MQALGEHAYSAQKCPVAAGTIDPTVLHSHTLSTDDFRHHRPRNPVAHCYYYSCIKAAICKSPRSSNTVAFTECTIQPTID